MNTYKCAPGASISTSFDPQGVETVVEFDKDGYFRTDNFHLIAVLDTMAADPRSPVEAASAPKKAAEPAATATTTEEDEA